jgi:two-component system, OmpR family, KDP operon response regulator KdpE
MNGHILIIEDEQDLRDALHVSLVGAGFAVKEAVDGITGLADAEKYKPDLILLDIGLPGMSGHQVLKEIRRNSWGKNIHVLLLTNADDPHNISQGIALKGDEYIIKSKTDLATIVKKVKQHLGGYHH